MELPTQVKFPPKMAYDFLPLGRNGKGCPKGGQFDKTKDITQKAKKNPALLFFLSGTKAKYTPESDEKIRYPLSYHFAVSSQY